ncbi:hypothetical protein LC593_36305 [Nostoc sp. CHAB 5844]|nr:hypothetical protein [Nostoc sp. CHAB 5844]
MLSDKNQRIKVKPNDITSLVIKELEYLGQKKIGSGRAVVDIGDGFYSWSGLICAVKNDRVELTANVGVHVAPIEMMWTKLKTGRHVTAYSRGIATYAVPIASLRPGIILVYRAELRHASEVVSKVAENINTVGLEFARSIGNYDALLPYLQGRLKMLGAYPEKAACCLLLMNRPAEAYDFVNEFNSKNPDYFEGFYYNFINLLSEKRNV